MPDGGCLTIETSNKWIDAAAGRVRDLPAGQYVALSVTDNGTGMAQAMIDRAFDPFYTTKPIGMGTGLGLSMVYGFVRQSKGLARIYSEVGTGTTVTLYLPRHMSSQDGAEAAEGADPQTELGHDGSARQRETVLVVDDEPAVLMLVTDVLEDMGYATIEASDGPIALKVLQSEARIDLLITDVGLPGLNGRQVADAARRHRPELKVLFITGYADSAVLSHHHLEPGMQVLTKPFSMDELANRVTDLLIAA